MCMLQMLMAMQTPQHKSWNLISTCTEVCLIVYSRCCPDHPCILMQCNSPTQSLNDCRMVILPYSVAAGMAIWMWCGAWPRRGACCMRLTEMERPLCTWQQWEETITLFASWLRMESTWMQLTMYVRVSYRILMCVRGGEFVGHCHSVIYAWVWDYTSFQVSGGKLRLGGGGNSRGPPLYETLYVPSLSSLSLLPLYTC